MLKEFMLTHVTPQLKDGDRENPYVQDPMRAAVIMLSVSKQYKINLEDAELSLLCPALRLPKLEKDKFLQYWGKFSQDVSVIKG